MVSRAPPLWNGALLVRAQANPVIGLVASVEIDTSETGSPVRGTGGNHLNEATGGVWGRAAAGGATVNVTGPLLPAGFSGSKLAWVATAVYCPVDRAGLALLDAHPFPVPVAAAAETIVPFAVAPAWIWTVTGVMSLAVPVKDGVMLLDGDWGEVNVTVGAAGAAVVT